MNWFHIHRITQNVLFLLSCVLLLNHVQLHLELFYIIMLVKLRSSDDGRIEESITVSLNSQPTWTVWSKGPGQVEKLQARSTSAPSCTRCTEPVCTHPRLWAAENTDIHTGTQTETHTCILVYITYKSMPYIHTYIHTHTHTRIHAYTHTQIHTYYIHTVQSKCLESDALFSLYTPANRQWNERQLKWIQCG